MVKSQPKSEFDAYRATYSEAVNEAIAFSGLDVDFFTRAKGERLLDLLEETLGDAARLKVLDVGCGIGNYHQILCGRIGQLFGADPSSESIEEARKRNPEVSYSVLDGDLLPFPNGAFDAAYAICVMHHVPPQKWDRFVSEMVRVTRADGMVIIFEHNPYNPLTRRAVSTCPFDADAVLLTRKQTLEHLRRSGLKAVTGRYILNIPSVTGPLRRLDDVLGWFPSGAQYFVCGRP